MSRNILQYFSTTDSENDNNDFVTPKMKSSSEIIPTESDKTLVCFTDGSSLQNGSKNSKCGYSIVFPFYEHYDGGYVLSGKNQTNNRAELSGIIKSFELADIIDPSKMKTLIIYTDSMLCINSLSKWIFKWKKYDWKKSDGKSVLNIDLLKITDDYQSKRPHVYKHIRAHTGKNDWYSSYNERADHLAKTAAQNQKNVCYYNST